MRAEQVLYTSCKRGIAGDTSGFQTYSYSPKIAEWELMNKLGVLFSQFNGSTMPAGLPILPTEEEAQSLFPNRYSYRRIEGKDNLCGFALCTYIGRDYPEGSQRAGNFLGHALIIPESECDYPGLLLGSSSFISRLDPEVVRKDERPALLPVVEVLPSESSSIEAIQDFLSDDYRSDIFKQMFACLLNGKDEKYNRNRRIFINDEPENISLWIASLMMAFPLKSALNLSFSTYEFDPEGSLANIVGVRKGTNYSVEKKASGTDYYFDLFDSVVDDSEFDELSDFCDFVCDSLMYSYDNLEVFHEFLKQFSYDEIDKSLKDAHNLYLFSQGVLSIEDYEDSEVSNLLDFALKHADNNFNTDLLNLVFESLQNSDISDDRFEILAAFVKSQVTANTISESTVINRYTGICAEHFYNLEMEYSRFMKLYAAFESKASNGFCKGFLSYIEDSDVKAWCKSDSIWKPTFIVGLYSTDHISVREFLNKDSFQYYVLEMIISMQAGEGENEKASTVRHLFDEYKKIGADSLTTLYLAVRLSTPVSSNKVDAAAWINGFRSEVSAFSESDYVSSLQTLYENRFEDDIDYLINAVAKDGRKDFLVFTELLEKQLTGFFMQYKQKLIEISFSRANDLSSSYRVFAFAAGSGKYNARELEQMLVELSEKIEIVNVPQTHVEYINGIVNYSYQLGISIPQRILLANLNLNLSGIGKEATKLFSSDKRFVDYANELTRMQALSVDAIDNELVKAYLREIAENVALLMLRSMNFDLQKKLFSFDSQTQLFFYREVFKNACAITKKANDYEPFICLIIYNSLAEFNIKNDLVGIINESGISPASLKKVVEKEKTAEKLNKYFDSLNLKSLGDFKTFINKLISTIAPENAKGGFFGFKKSK